MGGRWMVLAAVLAAAPVLAQEGAPVFSGGVRLPDGRLEVLLAAAFALVAASPAPRWARVT